MLAGIKATQQPVNFAQAKQQLYILTGIEPVQTEGRVSSLSRAEHLRFTFTEQGKDFYRVKALLKFQGIPHQADLYKKKGINAQNEIVLDYYIAVAKQQFIALQRYFLTGAILKLGSLKGEQFKIHDLDAPLKAAMTEILFDPQFLENMKKRNDGRYSLNGLMYYFAQLTINSMPCFAHLQSTGMIATLNIDQDPSSHPVLEELDAPAPVTLAYHWEKQQQKRQRSETSSKAAPSTGEKQHPKGK